MFRRSAYNLANQASRTIVRDPRKKKAVPAVKNSLGGGHPVSAPPPPPAQPLPFEPSQQNQESLGSSLASYALAGVGVSLGVILVRAVFGF